MARLVVTGGDLDCREFPIQRDVIMGRALDCDIRIPRPWVSRQHASIQCAHGRYRITDLHTTHGTLVNERKIRKHELRDGDKIRLGDCELTFMLRDGAVARETGLDMPEDGATVISAFDSRTPSSVESDVADSAKVKQMKTHLKILQEVAETACGTLDIEALLKSSLDQLLRVFPQATHAHAVLIDLPEVGKELCLSVARGGQSSEDVKMSGTLFKLATNERKALLAGDTSSDDRLSGAASIVGLSLRSMMCSPLIIADKVLGAIQVDTTSAVQPFSTDDLRLLATVAGQMAVAAESARLHHELMAKERLAAMGETISNLAHCIKNVLNALQGGAYILDIGIKRDESEKITKGWDIVKRNTDFMLQLAKDMLAYCKKEVVQRQPVDMAELLNNAMLMIQENAARKNVQASVDLQDGIPMLAVDATSMTRVIMNLLTNAVEACAEGQKVKLTAAVDKSRGQLVISVEDTGPGMPDNVKDNLFTPFFTTKGSRGTGLGLSLVKKVVDSHRGSIVVESEVGVGTTFRIHLPLEDDKKETDIAE